MIVPEKVLERFGKLVTKSLRRAIRAGTTGLGDVSVRAALVPASEAQLEHTGAMVALVPSEADLDRLQLPDGEPRDQLHLTMHFLGIADEIPTEFTDELNVKLEAWAGLMQPILGTAWNVGYFNPLGEEPCVALGIGGPMLDMAHDALCMMIEDCCVTMGENAPAWEPPENHAPWVPHVTLAYDPTIPADIDAAVERLGPITFDRIRFALGPIVYEYELGASMTAAAAEPYISLDDLSAIEAAWRIELAAHLVPALGRVYLEGAGSLKSIAAAVGADPVTLESYTAELYLAEAEKRLVGVGSDVWRAIRLQLVDGMQLGEDIDQLAKRVRSELVSSTVRAKTIARTEVISASNAGATEQARALGENAPARKIWIATNDGRTRPSHAAADGQVVTLEDSFEVGGASLDYPGDPYGPADEVINCRCTVGWEFDSGTVVQEDLAASGEPHAVARS